MDRSEKKKLREHIGEHIDVSKARLSDYEAKLLVDFVDNYDEEYKGQSRTRSSSHRGYSSDGTYVRRETVTHTFTDDVGIRVDHSYEDDDGETGKSSTEIKDARGIVNWLHDHR